MPTAAYLGPEGTHTHEAARACEILADWELVPAAGIRAAFQRAASGGAAAAVLPIENALEGSVGATLDALAGPQGDALRIRREIVREIRHSLLVRPGAPADKSAVRGVISHPQALAQCAETLTAWFPGAAREPAFSTSEAARIAAGRDGWVALGTSEAAALAGLEVRADDLSDEPGNRTRFVVLMPDDEKPTGRDRTSLVFGLERDRPGGLHDVLGEFATRSINLSRIESRPTRRVFGEYWFFADLEAHREDAGAADAITAAKARCGFFRVLGSYPRA